MNTLLCLIAANLAAPPSTPLQCPEPLAAKGEVNSGPVLAHTFELSNRGQGTLTITRVEGSCGCLRQSLSSSVLQPSETAKLTLEVNTLTQPAGPNRWQLTAAYKVVSPGLPDQTGELLLQMTATLKLVVTVTPPQLAFSTSSGATQDLVLHDTRGKPLTILKATTSSPHLVATIAPPIAQPLRGAKQTVAISLSPDFPVGHRDESVLLLTDDPQYAELRIPVRILKRSAGNVVAAPESVAVRFSADETEFSTLVQLRSLDGKPFGVGGVECDHPGVKLKWSTGASALAAIRVTVTEAACGQAGNSTVRVKVADQPGQEVVIPVSWTHVK
jgi:hypothetical protein